MQVRERPRDPAGNPSFLMKMEKRLKLVMAKPATSVFKIHGQVDFKLFGVIVIDMYPITTQGIARIKIVRIGVTGLI